MAGKRGYDFDFGPNSKQMVKQGVTLTIMVQLVGFEKQNW